MILLSFVLGLFFGVSLGILILGCRQWRRSRGETDWIRNHPGVPSSQLVSGAEIPQVFPNPRMTEPCPQPEARRHRRFKAEGRATVVLALSSGGPPLLSGQLLDISLGGLALSSAAEWKSILSDVALYLDIRDTRLPFPQVSNLPGRVVYAMETPRGNGGFPTSLRCGVQFGELSESQSSQLGNLIQNCSACEV